jgi:hypothetical protein
MLDRSLDSHTYIRILGRVVWFDKFQHLGITGYVHLQGIKVYVPPKLENYQIDYTLWNPRMVRASVVDKALHYK